ncbi:hypothetical protein [Pseudomonas abyssi]|uniref:hypothetical protein n=1 Tax=Pseudomonas abyssi TaxID=170540 RepID=UPI003C7CD5F8
MKELTLYLDGIVPERLSMKRLTAYLRALSDLCGSESEIHFDRVEEGSAQLIALVEDQAFNKVMGQVREVPHGLGSKRAGKAYLALSDLMLEDRVDGTLLAGGAKVFQFPRAKDVEQPLKIIKASSVQGKLYSVGGKDSTVPVRLEGADGETLYCEADVALAEKLAPLLFKPVRLMGEAEWQRRTDGSWRLIKLKVASFVRLEDVSFKEAVKRMKSAGGVSWNENNKAHAEILESRG